MYMNSYQLDSMTVPLVIVKFVFSFGVGLPSIVFCERWRLPCNYSAASSPVLYSCVRFTSCLYLSCHLNLDTVQDVQLQEAVSMK